jgi:hypothetical protein
VGSSPSAGKSPSPPLNSPFSQGKSLIQALIITGSPFSIAQYGIVLHGQKRGTYWTPRLLDNLKIFGADTANSSSGFEYKIKKSKRPCPRGSVLSVNLSKMPFHHTTSE